MTYVRGIVITNAGYLKVGIGYKLAIRTRIAPTNATNKTLSWSCNTPDIASVDSTGVVTGKKAGTAQICVRATDGSGVERTIDVTVENLIPVTQVEIYPDSVIEAKAGDVITHINIGNIQPPNATMMEPIWSSSDESIATVDYRGVVTTHKDGVVQITATGVGGIASDSCTINVDSREKVTIEKDGNYNKVVFENGKVWKCINCDMIYDQENAFNEELTQRRLFDLHDDLVNYTTYRTYTDDELRFLYTVDPCGVAKYVQMYAMQYDSLREQLAYKDRIFKLFHERNPKYFARNVLGEWYVTTDKSNLSAVLSEAELIFGCHTVYDFTKGWQLFNVLLSAISLFMGTSFYEGLEASYAIARVAKQAVRVISIGVTLADGYLVSFAANSYLDKRFKNTNFWWLLDAVSLVGGISELASILKSKPALYSEIVHYYVSNTKFRVFLKMANSDIIEMKNLEEAMKEID